MHAKTMEGLIGARTNIELLNTPLRVYKEARLKGDTDKMEQAMGYMKDFHEDAYEYKEVADEGMKKDAEEARKTEKEQREDAIRKRREEREKLEKKTEGNRDAEAGTDAKETGAFEETRACLLETKACPLETRACILEISGEGKVLSAGSNVRKTDAAKEPVTYTKTGEPVPAQQEGSISVSV